MKLYTGLGLLLCVAVGIRNIDCFASVSEFYFQALHAELHWGIFIIIICSHGDHTSNYDWHNLLEPMACCGSGGYVAVSAKILFRIVLFQTN